MCTGWIRGKDGRTKVAAPMMCQHESISHLHLHLPTPLHPPHSPPSFLRLASLAAQVKSLTRTLSDVERNLARLTGDIAYADTPLSNIQIIPREFKASNQMEGKIVAAQGYTDTEKRRLVTKKMRTRSIMGNWRVTPLYATAALLARWGNKCLNLPLIPVQVFTRIVRSSTFGPGVSSPRGTVAWSAGMGKEDAERTAEAMQEKWKRSATTGSFRRSVEIWGYALNFVRKEKRLTSKFVRGRITEKEVSIEGTEAL